MATNLQFINSFEIDSSGGIVQLLNCDNVFSDTYDVYYIKYKFLESSAGNQQWVRMRLIDNSGNVISDNEYDYALYVMPANASYYETKNTNQSSITYGGVGYVDDTGNAGGLYVFNPSDSSSYTFLKAQSSSTVGNVLYGNKGISVHKSTETIRGINFHTTTYWKAGTVSIYGVKG